MKLKTNLKAGTAGLKHRNSLSNRTRSYLLIPIAALITIAFARQAGAEVPRLAARGTGFAEVAAQLTATSQADARKDGQRSIKDFINAQGNTPNSRFPTAFYETPYAPGLPNYAVGHTSASCPGQFCQYATGSRIVVVDYAGGASDYLKKHGYRNLNTETEGSITERPLPDGRVQITIVLHTTNALTFVSTWDPNGDPTQSAETNARLFGSSVSDLLRDRSRRPALADSLLVMTYKQPPNRPLPDLVKAFAFGAYPDLELTSFYYSANATGALPNGSPATSRVLQHGVFPPPLLINGVLTTPSLVNGGWLSEFVDITPAK